MKSIIEQLCKGEVEYVSLKLPKDRLDDGRKHRPF